MQNSKLQLHSLMPLAEKWPFFFHIAFNSDCLRLKSMVHYVRGLFLISTSALATCTAFPAFQELIDCCAWQVPVAESFNRQSPEGLFWCGKYFEGNMDMVEWSSQVLEQIWKAN